MKKTALYEFHKDAEANFSEFGGYDMPLWYKSAKQEHLAVLNNVGLFDTSHMSVFTIQGQGAENLLSRAFTRDVVKLKEGKSVYGLFLRDDRTVVDDTVVYKFSSEYFMVVVNAGMFETVNSFLASFGQSDYVIENYCDRVTKIDIQGPKSLLLAEKLFGTDLFNKFPYFSFKGSLDDILISRSGYTGEFGFEIYLSVEKGPDMWSRILKEGEIFGIQTCGLASRDSLRVGAGLPLSHQDIGDWEFCNTPWDFALENPVESDSSYTYAYTGFDVRKLTGGDGKVIKNGEVIGRVLTSVSEVALTRVDDKIYSVNSPDIPEGVKIKGLAAGFVIVDRALEYGDIVTLSNEKRELNVEIVKSIRPDRTARKSLENIRKYNKGAQGV